MNRGIIGQMINYVKMKQGVIHLRQGYGGPEGKCRNSEDEKVRSLEGKKTLGVKGKALGGRPKMIRENRENGMKRKKTAQPLAAGASSLIKHQT